jgi:serine/threonine protein kinase
MVERKSDGVMLASKAVLDPNEQVLNEVALWEQVSSPYHDSILQLIEVVKTASELHFVTELMPYGELFDALDSMAFSEQACRMVGVQVASAIAFLHLKHNVAHCDIKPANVLCRYPDPTVLGSLKLADFGFCQKFTSRSRPEFTHVCGTLDYFAPELAASYRNARSRTGLIVKYGPAVDVWALGCLVYELLHGEPPFFAPHDDELQAELIEKGDLQFPTESFEQVSSHGKDFICATLEPQASSRPYIEDVLRHAWLQPVHDEKTRESFMHKVSNSVDERRHERRTMNRRLRVSALKVMALRRLSDPNLLTTDYLKAALHVRVPSRVAAPAPARVLPASAAGPTPEPSLSPVPLHLTGGHHGVTIESLSPQNLRAHNEEAQGASAPTVPPRRPSDISVVSYHSDDMKAREL